MHNSLSSARWWNPQYQLLDHWRCIAILWVLLFHGFGTTFDRSLHPLVKPLMAVAAPGWLGVHLFFVISGYCIASSLYKLSYKQDGNCWKFLKSRFWRLYPTYWAAFLFALLLNIASAPFNKGNIAQLIPDIRQWVGNLLLIQPYMGTSYYVIVYWSLVVEIGFYIIAGVLFVLWRYLGAKVAISIGLGLGGASVLLSQLPIAQIGPLGAWSEFLCGMLLFGALWSHSQRHTSWRNQALAIIVLLGVLSMGANFAGSSNWLWFSAAFALLLYFLYQFDSQIASIRALQWFKMIGLMSYSLYLLHVPIQGRVINLGSRFIPVESPAFILLQIIGWAVAISASYLFYRWIEKPLNDWRQRQTNSRNSKPHENPTDL
jgi:peptidoglycan/LPS O-acetylase OafA/YrhL